MIFKVSKIEGDSCGNYESIGPIIYVECVSEEELREEFSDPSEVFFHWDVEKIDVIPLELVKNIRCQLDVNKISKIFKECEEI